MSKKKGEDINPAYVGDMLTINSLRESVAALEDQKMKLLVALQDARDQLKQQKTDQADIYYYLNKKCDESFEVIASLEEQLLNEQSDREVSEKGFENRYEELRMSTGQTEAKLHAKISDLESRLEMLNNFSEMKEELSNKLSAANATIEEERAKYGHDVESLENRFLVEREKMKRNFDMNFDAAKRELEGTVDKKLSGKVRKTQVMNVLIRKELESQSKHAEKLLELNEDIVQRDRDLKMELQLARSMQEEMATKLAAYQRTIRQLNERIAAAEAEAQRSRQDREDEARMQVRPHSTPSHPILSIPSPVVCHPQREEKSSLQAEVLRLRKRSSKESLQLDEMWQFLAAAYRRIRRAADGRKVRATAVPAALGSDTLSELSDPETVVDHEQVLSELVREVVNKYPRLLPQALGTDSQRLPLRKPAQSSELDGSGPHMDGGSSSIEESAHPYIITGIGADKARPKELNPSDLSVDSLIGQVILSKSHSGGSLGKSISRTKLPGPRFKSVAVQTEGKVALYPPGSRWLQAEADSHSQAGSVGARSGRLVPPAAGSSGQGTGSGAGSGPGSQRSNSGRTARRSASRDRDSGRGRSRDSAQVDAQSLPTTLTLWGDGDSVGTGTGTGTGRGQGGNRSVQSAGRVAGGTTDRSVGAPPSHRGRSARRQIQLQLQQQQQAAKLQQLKRAGPVVAARIGARLPQLKVHLTQSQSQSQSPPEASEHTLSLQSVSGGGIGGGGQDSPSFTSRSRSSKPGPPPPPLPLSQTAFSRPVPAGFVRDSRPSPTASPAPAMKVHGLGFVSPLQLPQGGRQSGVEWSLPMDSMACHGMAAVSLEDMVWYGGSALGLLSNAPLLLLT
eukprot:gene22608-30880_t